MPSPHLRTSAPETWSLFDAKAAEVMVVAAVFVPDLVGSIEIDVELLDDPVSRALVRDAQRQMRSHGEAKIEPAVRRVSADPVLRTGLYSCVLGELEDAIRIISPSRALEAVRILRDRLLRSRLRHDLESIQAASQRRSVPHHELLDMVSAALENQAQPCGTTIGTLFDGLDLALAEDAAIIPSGFAPFDESQPEGAAAKGQVLMFTAAPKVGKSSLLLFVTLLMLSRNTDLVALWCRGEMALKTLAIRALAVLSGLPHGALRREDEALGPEQQKEKTLGLQRFRSVTPNLYDLPGPFTVADIDANIAATGAEVVVIDYLQKIVPAEGGRSQLEDLDAISQALTQIAVNRNVLMLVVSNMSGSAASGMPSLASMFKGSSTIGFDVDAGYLGRLEEDAQAMLDRGEDLPERYQIDWLCRGHRHGDGRPFSVMFERSTQRFFPVRAGR